MSIKPHNKNGAFNSKAATSIWHEIPSKHNPYIASSCQLHGYDILQLMKLGNYLDIIYLLFRGELPTKDQSLLLEVLMIACINPGPRHPATRATMNAGVSKANYEHILPIGLMVLGGSIDGSAEVEQAMNFLAENNTQDPGNLAKKLLKENITSQGDVHIAPGFGSYYGEVNIMAAELADYLLELDGAGKYLKWGQQFVNLLSNKQLGWLPTGIVAAALADLGFGAREAAGMFQIMSAPGLLAHGLEQTHKPITAMPMLEDENYVVQAKK